MVRVRFRGFPFGTPFLPISPLPFAPYVLLGFKLLKRDFGDTLLFVKRSRSAGPQNTHETLEVFLKAGEGGERTYHLRFQEGDKVEMVDTQESIDRGNLLLENLKRDISGGGAKNPSLVSPSEVDTK